ncbi:hypothetical protein BP6252_07208 [Coleophoma cylindrospora]|uniref:HD/PDEase domain-containing protein n=1 Tax=Coleophoma cylindrospora TaxID=1849047 RepID=A0A3D8RHH7_9HELO|nr:hypothetical protein BP6252_07208 [Coleophoma cylindrospora]
MLPTTDQEALITQVTEYVKQFMSNYDGSHDFKHIERVLALSLRIASASPNSYHLPTIKLAALLHDVGDKKYLQPGDDPNTMVRDVLLSFGAEQSLASKIQTICSAVSYSSEIVDYPYVQDLVRQYPELGPVQDADRLDAIGAVGIARVFTYGGSHGGRPLQASLDHFPIKLLKLEHLMKTDMGKQLARERTERLTTFMEWFGEESKCEDSFGH